MGRWERQKEEEDKNNNDSRNIVFGAASSLQ